MTKQEALDDNLKNFIEGGESYFERVTGLRAAVGTPFVKQPGERVMYEFSAVIGVSGSQKGCVFFTAPRPMLEDLVRRMGETQISDAIMADAVGEIANTISGNARATLGARFMISVPAVFHGDAGQEVRFPKETPIFVIPLAWNRHMSSIIVCLKNDRGTPAPRPSTVAGERKS